MDVLREIRDYNAGREPERLALKYRAMAQDPFAFMRGSCHLFYARLSRRRTLLASPPVWGCGDLHLQNFGSYRGDHGLTYFDINDFDEAALMPAAWELTRLCASALVAGGLFGLSALTRESMVDNVLDSYAQALITGKAQWMERERAEGPVRLLLDKAANRQRRFFLDGRTHVKDGQRRLRADGVHALPLEEGQRQGVEQVISRLAKASKDPDFFDVIDIARRVAGTGSLGLQRYVVLVRGKGSPDHNELLDLKEARRSALAPYLPLSQPAWKTDAQRIATLQFRVQAVSVAFLQPVKLKGRPFLLRALQPREDRIALEHLLHDSQASMRLMRDLGSLTAWAQLRAAGRQGSACADELIDFGQQRKWRTHLQLESQAAAEKVLADAQRFRKAHDEGAFGRQIRRLAAVT